jgi:lauroyl/myristoyl acyltransferase
LKPFAFARAAVPLPDCFRAEKTIRTARQWRMNDYLNHIMDSFPERLVTAKWNGCCRIEGISHLQQARQSGRPVILAFCHFGPYYLLRSWLRAAGFPVSFLVEGKATQRSALKRFEDRLALFPEIPNSFHLDELRKTTEFLAAGNPLLIAIDNEAGKQMDVPFRDGWTFEMATGAVRLAIRHQAELIPCAIIDEGRWRFRLEL